MNGRFIGSKGSVQSDTKTKPYQHRPLGGRQSGVKHYMTPENPSTFQIKFSIQYDRFRKPANLTSLREVIDGSKERLEGEEDYLEENNQELNPSKSQLGISPRETQSSGASQSSIKKHPLTDLTNDKVFLTNLNNFLNSLPASNVSQLNKRVRTENRVAIEHLPVKKTRVEMMSEYPDDHDYHHVTNGDITPCCKVATLFNMGNTCFLNSVLYTLRFAPTFLHNLHHLLVDLSLISTKLKENKTKTSSLGRNGSAVSGSSWRSASSKDLLSIGNNDIIPKTKDQIVTEKLHALFVTMNNLESKDSPDPYQPEALLQAIRDANSLFEGNHQQDAHEFFVELLSCLRVTCDKLNEQIEQYPELIKPPEPASANANNNSKMWSVRKSWKKPLRRKEKGGSKKNTDQENDVGAADSEDNLSTDECGDLNKKKFGYNFIAEDFQGVSLHRTTCLECEEVSELKEPFLEIQVPVNCRDDDCSREVMESSIFGSVCVTSEKLCDQNKYFCENCNRYNEAVRMVLYEKLPNIMVLHLKRFTTSSSGVQKVNTYLPTPLEIRCFCESCSKIDKSKMTPHRYRLNCVIMHLGASIASGHYIAYSRACVQTSDYIECTRDIPKNYLNSSGKEISVSVLKFFNKAKALGNTLSETQNGLGPHSKKNDAQVCQSINCCSVRGKLNTGSPHEDDWLEFDDEKVKILSKKEFIDMLNRKHDTTNTPYLLFYSKI